MSNIFKITVYIVFAVLFFTGWIGWIRTSKKLKSSSTKCSNKNKDRFHLFIKNNLRGIVWIAVYLLLVIASSIFVFINWDKCLDMVFFSNFDGYNIIWILWLFLLLIPLITVDNHWFKISSPFNQKTNELEAANDKKDFEELKNNYKKINNTQSSEGADE